VHCEDAGFSCPASGCGCPLTPGFGMSARLSLHRLRPWLRPRMTLVVPSCLRLFSLLTCALWPRRSLMFQIL
jgi:hypothetical protein